MGGRADDAGRESLEAPRPQGARRPSPARSPGRIVYPWPQRAPGLIETAFEELARRWKPILDAFDDAGVDVCYEIHPGEDLFDGATFERFLEARRRPQALQHPLRSVALRAAAARLSRPTSTSTTSGSRPSTSRTPSSIRPAGRASIRAMRPGSSAQAGSARSATGRSISAASSPSWRNTAIRRGRCSNGSAASSIRRTARAKAPSSSGIT